ncbi:hypothetical protein [Hymenobacter negativus]|nr:hypothetical protein [Hymenobacter negativus]
MKESLTKWVIFGRAVIKVLVLWFEINAAGFASFLPDKVFGYADL